MPTNYGGLLCPLDSVLHKAQVHANLWSTTVLSRTPRDNTHIDRAEHTEHTENKPPSTPRKREVVTDEFLEVYGRYPKKQNRKGSFDKWKKLSATDKQALRAYVDYMLANEWAGKETQYIPALAVVINQRRWLDDYQAQASQVDGHTEEKLSNDLKGILSA